MRGLHRRGKHVENATFVDLGHPPNALHIRTTLRIAFFVPIRPRCIPWAPHVRVKRNQNETKRRSLVRRARKTSPRCPRSCPRGRFWQTRKHARSNSDSAARGPLDHELHLRVNAANLVLEVLPPCGRRCVCHFDMGEVRVSASNHTTTRAPASGDLPSLAMCFALFRCPFGAVVTLTRECMASSGVPELFPQYTSLLPLQLRMRMSFGSLEKKQNVVG